MKILVVGDAVYIGSHMVKMLFDANHGVINVNMQLSLNGSVFNETKCRNIN